MTMDQRDGRFLESPPLRDQGHPLHLYSDAAKWMSAFGRCDSPCVASLCHRKHAYHSHETKFFVVVHLQQNLSDKNLSETSDGGNSVVGSGQEMIDLFTTDEFHSHYGIDRKTKSLLVGPIPVFPLSRVVLSAKTENTFEWANGKAFETGLMITGTCHKNLLARQDDQFLGVPHKTFGPDHAITLHHFKNLVTVECFPVKQGYIHVNTEIIIIEPSSEDSRSEEVGKPSVDAFDLKFVSSDLLRSVSFHGEKYDPQMDIVCSASVADLLGAEDRNFVNMELVCPNDEEVGDMLSPRYNGLNDNSMDEGEYFSIDVLQPEENQIEPQIQNPQRICRLRVGCPLSRDVLREDRNIGNHLRSSIIYISPLLWFNTANTSKYSATIDDSKAKVSPLEEDGLPPFAGEIHLSLVLSPTYSPGAQFDNTLLKHMKKTTLLKKGDLIAIKTRANDGILETSPNEEISTAGYVALTVLHSNSGDPEFLSECDRKDASCEVLYYKAMGFSPDDNASSHTYFRVDLKHTSLYQDGTVNSLIPQPLGHAEDCDSPAGLSEYTETLQKMLLPYTSMEMENSAATVLVSGSPGCGKWSIVSSVCRMLNLHMLRISCYELMADSSGAMDAKITTAIQRAIVYAPCMVVLSGIDCLGRDNETGQPDHRVCSSLQNAFESLQSNGHPIAIVGITSNKNDVVAKIRSQFVHQLEVSNLSEKERSKTILQLLRYMPSGRDVDVKWIAKHTVGFSYGDLWELARQATGNARQRITKECAIGTRLSWMDEMNVCAAGITNQQCDFVSALQHMQSQRADVIGVPKIPDVKWDDIGGLEDVKASIKDTIQLPLEHPELVASGLRRSGILLYGPPGTGKTLLAKAVATQCSLSFLSIKGPELINMYVGQSEENVRKVFSRARDAAPCVVFFDELDSLAPNRGRSGDSGGVMDRVVSQLLAELDGLVEADEEKQIFVIGASNRPDLIDPALLRPGRFDKLLYVGINSDKVDQLKILEAQTKRANLDPSVCLDEVIRVCPDNMTGADFYALTSEALMNAIRRRIAIEEKLEMSDSTASKKASIEPLVVQQDDFFDAVKNIVPSVSAKELRRFEAIKSQLAA